MNPVLSGDAYFESKDFMATVNVTEFPIRDHKVVLRICVRQTSRSPGAAIFVGDYE